MKTFIRALTKAEKKSPTQKLKAWRKLSETISTGSIVYMPYGTEGSGFYYKDDYKADKGDN